MRIALILLVALAGCSACSWFSDDKGVFVDRSDDYLDAEENPPLIIPEDLQTGRVADPLPIPPITESMRPQYFADSLPRPDAIYANDNRDEVRIQRLGDRRWLVIPEAPTTVWPKVKQFLADNGVAVAYENAGSGRLDTEWLTVGNERYRDVIRQVLRDAKDAAGLTTGQDRFRIRVEQGLRENTSEVHVRHENESFAETGADDLVDLNQTPSHLPEAELDMLNELGAYIAARVSEQTVSMIARDIGSPVKTFLDRDAQGEPVLRLLLDYQRSWATVGQALARAGIPITESDEATGVYQISVPEDLNIEEAEPGFFGRMFSFGGDDEIPLQLQVSDAGDGSFLVKVLDAEGQPIADRAFSQEVLVIVREYGT